jgi:3-deoxy-D-manno-octulosonic-acid transferase
VATAVYQVFIWLYRCGAMALAPFNQKARRWLSGREYVFEGLKKKFVPRERKTIWFHCASLGEFEQARPLLEAVRRLYPQYYILLSFFSPSGYEVRKNYEGADYVCYLPLDGARSAARFLEIVQPSLVIWIKYEYWHFYLKALQRNHIPLLLVSGIFRPEQPFFKSWGNFHRAMLGRFSFLFVQNAVSKKLLDNIGYAANTAISGDTRFDRVITIAAEAAAMPRVAQFLGGQPVVVAGSTWEEDEEVLDHFANTHAGIKFIIAPHEIDEEHLQDIEKLFHKSIRYSALTGYTDPSVNTLIVDNIGMLASLYQYATVAYIGGGFGNDGVHNVLEAAVYGRPVVFGPVYEKFAEAVDLVEAGGAFDIGNALELEQTINDLLNNKDAYQEAAAAAAAYVYANKGATSVIMSYIQENRLLTS